MPRAAHFSILACVALLFLLGGCLAGQQRGLAGTSYVSTSRPAIAVTARDMAVKTAGRGYGTLMRPSLTGALSPRVRTVVYGSDAASPMAIVAHAELPVGGRWIWTTVWPRPGGIHAGTEIVDGVAFAAFTYLVPQESDPYGGLVGDPVEPVLAPGEEADRNAPPRAYWLARHLAVRTNFNHDKIILEYREPAPGGLTRLDTIPYGMTDAIAAFEQRARSAFALSLPSPELGPVQDGYPVGVRWRYMADPFLGDVMEHEPLSRFDD